MRPNRATQELETWNPAGERSTIKLPGGGFDLARATFDPSRRMLAAAAENGSVHLWECQTGARKTALGGHRGSVETFAFSPDGRAFASTSPMDGLKIWDIDNGLERFTLRRGIEGTSALAFSADSALVAQAGTLDYRIDVWDAKTASHWGRLTGHAATVAALAFAPQGRQVASASSDGTVRVWDLAACRRVNEELAAAQSELADLQQPARKKMGQAKPPRGAAKQPVPLARWQFDGDYRDEIGKLHGTAFGNARIENGRLMLDGLDSYVTTAPIAQPLAAKSLEAWVALDDLDQRGGAALALQTLDAAEFDAIVFGELEPRRWMAGSMSYVRTQSFAAPLEDTLSGELVHVVITYTRDGIVTCYRDGKRYGTPYRTTVLRFDAGQAGISFGLRHMPSVPDRLLAGEIEQAALYNRALTANEVAALAKSGLGTRDRIRSGLSPRQFRRYDELTAKIMRLREEPLDSLALVGHAGAVLDVAYSPDGARLASVGADGTLRLWDSGSGSSLATYLIDPAHSAPLRVAFSPEGRHVGVIDSLGQVHVVRP